MLTIPESREQVRSFLRALSEYIVTVTGSPDITSYMLTTLIELRKALLGHEDALSELFPLENGETDPEKRRPLSKYLYRGLYTNAKIVCAIRYWCGEDRDPAKVLNHRFQAATLSYHIVLETQEQQRVIYDYKIANNSLW